MWSWQRTTVYIFCSRGYEHCPLVSNSYWNWSIDSSEFVTSSSSINLVYYCARISKWPMSLALEKRRPSCKPFKNPAMGCVRGGLLAFGPNIGGHLTGGETSSLYSSPVGKRAVPIFFSCRPSLIAFGGICKELPYEVSGRTSITPPYRNPTLSSPSLLSLICDIMDIWKEPSSSTY